MLTPNRSARRAAAGVLVALVALAACGDDAEDTTTADTTTEDSTQTSASTDATFPVTVVVGDTEVTIDEQPDAIVSISPTATEMLFAIDAGDQVVAVDDFSYFPEEAPVTDLSGFDPNLEAIIAFEPDLVVLSNDANDVVAGLAEVGVPALVLPAAVTLEDTYDQIEALGQATGEADAADALVEEMTAEIAALVAQVPERDEPLTYFHELDDTLFSVTSQTFIGEIYALAGLENIADAADPDGESFGYPQLSPEFLISADPDLVFLADTRCCAQDAATFGARPGFAELTAVAGGNVIELDDDIASRWGPRVVDFLAAIVDATTGVGA